MKSSNIESVDMLRTELSKRDALRLLSGLGLAAAAGTVTAQETEYEESWPQYRYNSTNTGHAPNNTGPLDDIGVEWETSLVDPENIDLTSVYPVVTENNVCVTTENGEVAVLDRVDGSILWRKQPDADRIWAKPTISGGTVYCGTMGGNNRSGGGITVKGGGVYAFDLETGDEVWSKSFESSVNSGVKVLEGTLYCCVLGTGILALDAATGDVEWTYETETRMLAEESPAILNETVYGVDNSGTVYAINASDGTEKWQLTLDSDEEIRCTPAVTDSSLFVGSDNSSLYRIDAESGEVMWSYETTGEDIRSGPAITDESVYLSGDEKMYRLSKADGTEQWSQRLADQDPAPLEPVLVDNTIFVSDWNNGIFAIAPDTGSLEWKFSIQSGPSSEVVVADEILYVGSQRGNLVAISGGHSSESSTTPTTFQRFSQAVDSNLFLGLLGLGGVGGAYAGYKKFIDTDDEQSITDTPTPTADTPPEDTEEPSERTVTSYGELNIENTVEEHETYALRSATFDDQQAWVISPPETTSETIDSEVYESFSNLADRWGGIDAHQNLLSIYGTGMEPFPWFAVQQGEDSTIALRAGECSTETVADILEQVCDGVHHVSRYGGPYENLTTESIFYSDDRVRLRGVLDQLDNGDPWYRAPEEFDGDYSEQSTVYRIGLIGYELVSGTLPYADYPDGSPQSAVHTGEKPSLAEQTDTVGADFANVISQALSQDPADRYETVLHLRDALQQAL
jgi:outer membrane protein assembly factor BamB